MECRILCRNDMSSAFVYYTIQFQNPGLVHVLTFNKNITTFYIYIYIYIYMLAAISEIRH